MLSANLNQSIPFETGKFVINYQCSGNHLPSKCQFLDKECFYCKKKGHTIKVCRKCKDLLSRNVTSNVTNAVDDVYSDDEHVSEDDIFNIHCHEIIIMKMYERIKSRHASFMHSSILVQ